MNSPRNKRKKFKSLYVWHRYAGLFAVIFVILITLTGIALNHTDNFALKSQHLSSKLILDLYNIQTPSKILRFKTNNRIITQADDLLFIDKNSVIPIEATLKGVYEFNGILVVALTNQLLLLDSNNLLVETLQAADGVPKNIDYIGMDAHQRFNIIANGRGYLLQNDLTLKKNQLSADYTWLNPEPISDILRDDINQLYRSKIISLETFVLDIHSGRFFGQYGTLFFDVVGFVLIFLAVTGVIIWLRHRRGY